MPSPLMAEPVKEGTGKFSTGRFATAGPMKLAAQLLGESGADCLTAGATFSADALKNPEPDFYILGAKSYGTNSNFLMQTGHKQIRDIFRLIEGNQRLDLHHGTVAV